MGLTADFIQALAGLSPAELPTSVIDTLRVIPIAEAASTNYTFSTTDEELYYQGYKAITLLSSYLLLAVPEEVKDNFNSFSRYDNIHELIDFARAKVAEVEAAPATTTSLLDVVPPEIDPVTQEAR
jgi:hypothetical protein